MQNGRNVRAFIRERIAIVGIAIVGIGVSVSGKPQTLCKKSI